MTPRVAASVVAVAAFTLSVPVHAQSKEDLANAEALFDAAKALLDAHQYADACTKFAESKRLAPGLGVTLYLADCYERIGRTASAWTEFRAAEGLARERNDRRADVARNRAQALEPTLERVTVVVAPSVPRSGLRVLVDGALLPAEEWGLPSAVDPGDHVVSVSAPDHANRTYGVHVGASTPSATVQVDNLVEATSASTAASTSRAFAAPTPAAVSGVPTPSERDQGSSSDPGMTNRWIGMGVGALGVVGVGIGSGFGLAASSKLSDSNKPGGCDSHDVCTPSGTADRSEAGNDAARSTLFFALGGVALASGIVLYLTAPHAAAKAALMVAPTPMIGGGGAVVRATF